MSYLFSFLLFLWCITFPAFLLADSHPVINEFLPHPSIGNKEWVEIYVPNGQDVTNYWIDDDTDFTSDSGNSSKKRITSVVQGNDTRYVYFELPSSMFNNDGDTVALFTPDGQLVDQYVYSADPGIDVSIGRTPDGTGDFHLLISATRGSPNSPLRPPDTATPEPTVKPTHSLSFDKAQNKNSETSNATYAIKSTRDTSVQAQVTENMIADSVSVVTTSNKNNSVLVSIASKEAYPTAILGISTKSAERKKTPIPTTPCSFNTIATDVTRQPTSHIGSEEEPILISPHLESR